MKRKTLTLLLAAFSLMAAAQTVFEYGFETPPSELTIGKLDYLRFRPGDVMDPSNTLSHSGAQSLMLKNTGGVTANSDRGLQFSNLTLEPHTSYRVSYWIKGSNEGSIRSRLLMGNTGEEIPLLGAANTPYDYTLSGMDSTEWVQHSAVFYYESSTVQSTYFTSTHPNSQLSATFSLCLNAFNDGTYYFDDIRIAPSTVKSITYNNDVLKIDFGYSVNFNALTNGKDYTTLVMPKECVQVTRDGTPLDLEAVEIQGNNFYVFLESDQLTEADESSIKVSFTNPTGSNALLYTDAKFPGAWNPTSDKRVVNFSMESAQFDMDLLKSSIRYEAPFFKFSLPENQSFHLPLTTKDIATVYSLPVDCGLAKATLTGPSGSLTLQTEQNGFSDTIHWRIPEGTDLLSGAYDLTVSDITSEFAQALTTNTLHFEFGQNATPTSADTVLKSEWRKDGFTFGTDRKGFVPYGYKIIWGTKIYESGATGLTSCPRAFMFANNGINEFDACLYLSSRDGDTAQIIYGGYENNRLHLKPGVYLISWKDLGWDPNAVGPTYRFYVKSMDNTSVYVRSDLTSKSTMGYNWDVPITGTLLQKNYVTIKQEGDYLLYWVSNAKSDWYGHLLGNITVEKSTVAEKYTVLLQDALQKAIASRQKADSTIYNGPAKNHLNEWIQTCSNPSETAPSWYETALSTLKTAITLMDGHKTRVDDFISKLAAARTKLNAFTNTAIANASFMNAYPRLVNAIATYENTDCANDATCQTAIDSLNYYTNYLQNVSNGTAALKFRINKAVTLAKSLPIPVHAEALAAAESSSLFTDDDAIANALNGWIKRYIDGNLATDTLVFKNDTIGKNLDAETAALLQSKLKDSLDLTCFVKNPNFYTLQRKDGLSSQTFPGWSTQTVENIGVGIPATDLNPISDTYVQGWLLDIDSFEQTVNGLPAGVYDFGFTTRQPTDLPQGGWTLETMKDSCGVYVTTGDSTYRMAFKQAQKGWPTSTNTWISKVKVAEGASVRIGMLTKVFPSWTPTFFFGDPVVYLVGKDNTYTYTTVRQPSVNRRAVETSFFNIQGVRIAEPSKGLYLKRTVFDDGSTQTEKINLH
jgi:hypothetical protein